MNAFSVVPASTLSREDLVVAFNHAFQGYLVPMTHTSESLGAMIETNDVILSDSRILRSSTGDNIGVALLAVRQQRSWVAGMAIAPEWRGRGAGKRLMQELLRHARQRKLHSVQLEVLAANDVAYHLYERLGFRTVRSLLVYGGVLASSQLMQTHSFKGEMVPVALSTALRDFEHTHPVAPPWQRECPSLLQMQKLHGIALQQNGTIQAYLLALPAGIGQAVMDIGSRAPAVAERTAHGIALLRQLLANTPDSPVRAINVPPGDPLGDALAALGCPVINQQYEMLLDL